MKNLIVFCFILLSFTSISAQNLSPQVLNATGYTGVSKTMELSWSVGEMATATLNGTGTILTQGFLQPDIHVHNSSIESISLADDITVFPNPVHDQLFINESKGTIETISVYNALGQRIIEEQFLSPVLDMSLLKPGIYFINLLNYGRTEVHTFKIIKY